MDKSNIRTVREIYRAFKPLGIAYFYVYDRSGMPFEADKTVFALGMNGGFNEMLERYGERQVHHITCHYYSDWGQTVQVYCE